MPDPNNGQPRKFSIPRLVVVGSLNMDLVIRTSHIPRPGETIHGEDLSLIPGGKGANQAVAAAQLGARCEMVGRVGDDVFGGQLIAALRERGVATDYVRSTSACSSGVALIHVEASGENSITIVAGSNGRMTPMDLETLEPVLAQSNVLLLQLEIPEETVAAAIQIARRNGVYSILDTAPAPTNGLPEALYAVDLLTPNQHEAQALTGIEVVDEVSATRAARILHDRGARRVVIKMGAAGAFALDENGQTQMVPSFPVQAVDTTAAGDAFTAALGVALAEGRELVAATRFACAAGALATTVFGAQPAMPDRSQVEKLLRG